MIKEKLKPSLLQSLIPIIILIGLLFVSVFSLWQSSSLDGANQMALLFSAAIAMLIGWKLNFSFKEMLKGATNAINTALPAAIILLLIGALAGTWLISGIVPSMIYYGLKILNPTIFLFSACIISAIISIATGSSWSTIATVGVALLGIGEALGFSSGLVAGAIISGAYFGDKMSPMSDTTNLAPAVAGSDLFTHIRYMLYTTVPSIVITLIIFLVIGFFSEGAGNENTVNEMMAAIDSAFYISPVLFLVPVIVIGLIIFKVDAIPAIFAGVLLGGLFAVIFQSDLIIEKGKKNNIVALSDGQQNLSFQWFDDSGSSISSFESADNLNGGKYVLQIKNSKDEIIKEKTVVLPSSHENENEHFLIEGGTSDIESLGVSVELTRNNYLESAYRTCIDAMTVDTSVNTGNITVDDLLGTGGMSGMLFTIWLIVCAMAFGGTLEVLGMLNAITERIVARAKSNGSLIASTALTAIGFNVTASDQYLSIVVPGKMYANEYERRGLAPQNLSRTLEDAGTVTSVLIPWNTCGAVQANVLHVATGEYFMYCFFNLISPVMTILFGVLGIKLAKIKKGKGE